MADMTAADAVRKALADSSATNHFDIGRFWMSLYEYGYEVVPRVAHGYELIAQSDGSGCAP